jgi:hypothetical protein
LFFFSRWFLFIIGLKDKGTPVFAVFAEIDLTDISPGDGKDILAFTDWTIEHTHQLYMSIRYKN